ncbi:hypothetical protein C8R44DRAFT_981454 [Mycena epipterygia]|nr:hypothetical protein C8R44DRAFT_981454 [Mycena epipterygia]
MSCRFVVPFRFPCSMLALLATGSAHPSIDDRRPRQTPAISSFAYSDAPLLHVPRRRPLILPSLAGAQGGLPPRCVAALPRPRFRKSRASALSAVHLSFRAVGVFRMENLPHASERDWGMDLLVTGHAGLGSTFKEPFLLAPDLSLPHSGSSGLLLSYQRGPRTDF